LAGRATTSQVSTPHWAFAAVLLVTSYLGGMVGASIARLLQPVVLRYSVVVLGAVVGVALMVTG